MRLTLRTLLAYLDDVLDPVDKEELSQKIESSDFAEDLVHRTRDTVRRLRLSAPKVIGTGMGLDPNTVAEYLDNVMPPDQVGDFERICLDSDIHLAEATACHHVLTMVLGAPADVDPIARQRMYSIASEAGERKLRVEAAHVAHQPTTVAAAIAASPAAMPTATAQRPRAVEVPEYLRAGAWWRSPSAAISLAVVVLIGTAIVFLTGLSGWFDQPPGSDRLTAQSAAPAADSANNNPDPLAETPAAQFPEATADNSTAPNTAPSPLASPPQPLTPGIPPLAAQAAAPPDSTQPGEVDPYQAPNPPAAATPDPSIATSDPANPGPAASPSAPNAPPTNAVASIPSALPASSLPESPPLPPPSAEVPAVPSAATGSAAEVIVPPTPLAANATAPSTVPLPAAPPDSGTYMGGKTVLLRHDDKAGAWFRVEPRSAVVPGERVLALPEFRPRIALVSGIQLDLSGGTQAVMGIGNDTPPTAAAPSTAEIIPSLDLTYGRIVLVNPTNASKQIRLKLGTSEGLATLAHNATLGIELERKHVPGEDPRQTPAPVETRFFAPDGGVVWHDTDGDHSIDKPSRWTLVDGKASAIADDTAPPEWIDHEPIGQLSEQRYGAPEIESTLTSASPADTQLLEIFQGSKRKEVKSLVARSCIHVGLFQPFIDALRDSEQKANWKMHIDTLRSAMALSPESANKVWQALVEQRGKPTAADLYEMLCGYTADQIGHTPDQMKTGALVKLIDRLDNDSLDYRVLAVQDLYEITGKQFMQNPAAKPAERTQNIRRWRARLDAGELKPVTQP